MLDLDDFGFSNTDKNTDESQNVLTGAQFAVKGCHIATPSKSGPQRRLLKRAGLEVQ